VNLWARRVLGAGIAILAFGALAAAFPMWSASAPKFSAKVDNPYVPLTTVPVTVLEGVESDPEEPKPIKTRVETRALPKTVRVAGVDVTAVRVKEYEGGKLKEATTDYFAQRRDGAVIYFGQRVDNYRNGKIVAHRGEWIAGRKKAKRGLFMPANPKVGQVFVQERVPGIAIDRSTVLAVGRTITTPAGTFGECMKVRDYAVIDKVSETKYYCAGIGLVRDDERHATSSLTKYERAG
jgi:hypothetical protein